MDVYNVIVSPRFEIELMKIYWYIYNHFENPIAANRLYNKVEEKVLNLTSLAEFYPRIHEFKNEDYRKILVNKYVIVYELNKDTRTSLCSTYIS